VQAKDPNLVVIAVASKTEFSGHIPGSFHIWRPDYEAPPATQDGVTDNIVDAAGFTKLMQGLGVDADSKVVVYDHKYDPTRIWWAFFYYGKARRTPPRAGESSGAGRRGDRFGFIGLSLISLLVQGCLGLGKAPQTAPEAFDHRSGLRS
jgi:hypothetical protein